MLSLSASRCAFSSGLSVQSTRAKYPAPSRTTLVVEAAVPKKKVSKSKTNIRFANWNRKVWPQAERALFLAKRAMKAGNAQESSDKDMGAAAPASTETTTPESQ